MGILDRYTTVEDKEELARNLNLPNSSHVNTKIKTNKASLPDKNKTAKITEFKNPELNDGVLLIINDFVKTYKESDKTSRMIRIQDAHYRKLVSLRADGISVSEFINFAVHFTLELKDYDEIISILKQ